MDLSSLGYDRGRLTACTKAHVHTCVCARVKEKACLCMYVCVCRSGSIWSEDAAVDEPLTVLDRLVQ